MRKIRPKDENIIVQECIVAKPKVKPRSYESHEIILVCIYISTHPGLDT
jgi:hypothetical protein